MTKKSQTEKKKAKKKNPKKEGGIEKDEVLQAVILTAVRKS